MAQDNLFDLFYTYLEERPYHNVRANIKDDDTYQDASKREEKLYQEYQNLHLSEEQRKTMEEWMDGSHATSSAYNMVVFRMGMQLCFSLMTELADWK